MAQRRTNFTISEANHHWLQGSAPSERAMSRIVDELIQRERTLGPIERRLQLQADRLASIIPHTADKE